jgi:uncharacterized cupin superfamily protein
MKPCNIDSLTDDAVETFAKSVETRFLGRAAGSERIYANIDTLPPGTYSTKYHSHSLQEEFFLILDGSGILRHNGEEQGVGKGDFFAKTPGNFHQFFNSGTRPLRILDVGTVDRGDFCSYPDEDVVLDRDNRRATRNGETLAGWSSEPNLG